jgi:CheY-like chemotaxis protein
MQVEGWFIEAVRDALGHLYDFPYLQAHPLATHLLPGTDPGPRERVRLLRTLIIGAIDELNPGSDVPFRSVRARAYYALKMRYVEGLSVGELARELSVTHRQVYRDLHKAELDLAALLWARRTVPRTDEPEAQGRPQGAQSVLSEAERVAMMSEEVCLGPLVQGALEVVGRLCTQRGVHVRSEIGDTISVYTDRMLARQALVSAVSHVIQDAEPGTSVWIRGRTAGNWVYVEISYVQKSSPPGPETLPVAAQELLRRLGGRWSAHRREDGRSVVSISLRRRPGTSVLVIDDNEGLLDLFRRFLTDQDYDLSGASDGREGLRLAEEKSPDVIVLDVMMPRQDGWEILQHLRSKASTRHIPVIVCSVLDDPQLALSLGAADFVPKPVSRDRLLSALARCRAGSRPHSPPASPAGTV